MLNRLFLLPFLLLLACPASAQDLARNEAPGTASISGFVRDAQNGETLIMANVVLEGTSTGTATNNSGYYTLTGLDAGTYTLVVSYVGYSTVRQEVTLRDGEHARINVELQLMEVTAGEVTVTAEREAEREARNIGVSQLKIADIRQLPTVLEPDVFRSLQLLPGVKAASDYSSGLYIRGGSPDQTLIQLDRNTVYNPTHFFGFFSAFNPDAIKDVRLFKGGYPAEYGGRLGSVLDIYNKDGNRREVDGTLSVGLLASRAMAEGPYSKGSWMFAIRRSTLEPLLAALRKGDVDGIPDKFYFYDANGKVNFDASENNRFSLAFYAGNDRLKIPFLEDANLRISVGNQTVAGNWTHIFSEKLFSNFTVANSHYFSLPLILIAGTPIERNNRVDDASIKADFEYIPNGVHSVKVGLAGGNFQMRIRNSFNNEETLNERLRTFYGAAYIQDTWRPTSLWTLTAGLRANYFENGQYLRLEPRANVEYRPTAGVRLQAGYGRYYQFLTLISSEVFSAFDLWLTTDDGIRPAYGDQYILGAKTELAPDLYLDVEGYYRTMENLFELNPFLPDVGGLEYAELFRIGQGFAQGIELQLQKARGRVNGFVSYTLGRTRRRFPDIREFQYYTPKYDRTHDVNLVMNWYISRAWRFSGVFTYGTGQAYTQPTSTYIPMDYPNTKDPSPILVTEYNNARLPDYHRLDLGISRNGRFFGIADYELQFQVINAYGRRNIWFYFFQKDEGRIKQNEAPQIPVPIPNIAFTLNF